MYYLQSRFYNPEWGRFINADTTELLQETKGQLLSHNLFAYCLNNHVNMVDTDGEIAEFVIGAGGVGAANFWNPAGWILIGAAGIGALALGGYAIYKRTQRPKPVNLPSYKKIKLDMEEILSGHGPNDKRGGPKKDRFPWYMTAPAIEKAVRQAYRYGKVINRQGERVFVRGPWGRSYIEMWVNTVTDIIETAWPK